MSLESHIHTLEEKQGKLSKNINKAYGNHLPDEKVKTLKKERLRIEDEIEQLKHNEG